MRVLALTLAFLLSVASARAQATKSPKDSSPCADAGTQAELTECYSRRARSADSTVRRAFENVLAKTVGKRRKFLRASQQAWLTYRENYCRFDAAQYDGGSRYSSEFGACLVELSNVRTEELLSDASAERETGGAAPRGQ
jgi:uncharacterized protein YecT (DUF1311 family)